MKKILFFIHNLGPGGAEKVLVNLANHMDQGQFEVTVMTMFDEGVNRQFLKPHIRYKYFFKRMFRGNSHLLALFPAQWLHSKFIDEKYDIEIAYLEGPSARIISGCTDPNTKIVSWIHTQFQSKTRAVQGFRSMKDAAECYRRFHKIIGVSRNVSDSMRSLFPDLNDVQVLYNTNETEEIRRKAAEPVELVQEPVKLCAVGRLIPIKGFDRLLRIHKRLREQYNIHTYILGVGAEQANLQKYVAENGLQDSVTFPGYQTNPYKYVANCDLFVCSSHTEGFSTAATEALIVGTPVCTVEVSGMKEMLGDNNEYGIVTENDEEALYQGIKKLLDDPQLLAHYKKQAVLRGKDFSTENTVKAVEEMVLSL